MPKISKSTADAKPVQLGFLADGGKMSKLVSSFDWTKTNLGPIEDWPQSLKTAINIMLQSPVKSILLWGKEGIMIYNDAYAEFAGERHPLLLGSIVTDAWPESADFNRNVMKQGLQGKSLSYKNQQLTLYRQNISEEIWMDLSYSPVMGENGKPAGVLAIIIETTESVLTKHKQKQAEDALKQENENRFRFMAETLPLKIFVADAMGKITYFNPQWCEYTGLPMKTLRQDGVQQFLHPDDLPASMQQWRRAIKNGQPLQNEQRLRRFDGQYRRHISFARPMLDQNGKVINWFGSMTDIEDVIQTSLDKEKLELKTVALREQRAQLMAINNTKDEFIALSSHQLRTPATSVKQYLSLVLGGYFGPLMAEQSRNLQVAYDSNERQLNIISDLLKTAQIDSDRFVLNKKSQAISTILKESITELRSTFELKKQTVTLQGVEEVSKVYIDSDEMKLVFVNLLENASKYSYPDTKINVRLRKKAEHLEIQIHDQGVGISKANAEKIFEKFTRIDNELSDTVTGTGLGLYWVKKIINLHGGTITVKSLNHKGSTFIVRLPL